MILLLEVKNMLCKLCGVFSNKLEEGVSPSLATIYAGVAEWQTR